MAGNRLDIVIKAIDQASGTINKIGLEVKKQKAAVEGMDVMSARQTETGTKQAAAAAGIAVALAGASREAAVYDQGMRDVNSIAKKSEKGFGEMGQAVLDIARDPKVTDTPDTLAAGLYDLYSSGLQGAVAMDTLAIASKGAAAGQSDTATSAAVLASVMNAYNRKTGKDASQIMDVLFKTVEAGVVRFDELASSLGNVTSTASTVGVGIEEVGGAIATMTKRGIGAPEAITALNNMLMQFLSPSKAFQQMIEANGYATGLQIIQTRGLSGAMDWLTQATGGSADKLAQVLGEVRAVKGAMSLTGEGAEMFAADLEAVSNSSGAMESALDQQSRGAMFRWKRGVKDMRIAVITFGAAMLPVMNLVSSGVSRVAQWFDKLSPATKTAVAYAAIGAVVVLGLAAAYNIVAGSVISAMASMRVASLTQAVLSGQTAAMTTQLGLTSGAIGAMGTAWTAMAARGTAAWTWLTASSAMGWKAQWAATGKLPVLGKLWTGFFARIAAGGGAWAMLKAGATGAWSALLKLPSAIVGISKALWAAMITPLGVVIMAAAAALAMVLYTWKTYREMKEAQKQEKESAAALASMESEYGVKRDASGAIISISKPKSAKGQAGAAPSAPTAPTTPTPAAAGESGTDSGVPDFNALLKQAREAAAAEAGKGEGVAGAAAYLDYVKGQQAEELRKLEEQAKAGDADASEKLAKAQQDAAAAIADAEVGVAQESRDAATQAQQAATARAKGLAGLPAFAQAGGVNDLAGTGGEMVPPRLERVASPADASGAGQWGRTLTLTIQVNTMEDVKRAVAQKLDEAFA